MLAFMFCVLFLPPILTGCCIICPCIFFFTPNSSSITILYRCVKPLPIKMNLTDATWGSKSVLEAVKLIYILNAEAGMKFASYPFHMGSSENIKNPSLCAHFCLL